MTYIQVANVTLDNLQPEEVEAIEQLIAEDKEAHLVNIVDGDESLTRKTTAHPTHGYTLSPEKLLDMIEDGEIQEARIVISEDIHGSDFFLTNAYEIRKGLYHGEYICRLATDQLPDDPNHDWRRLID
jgi:hypothetical protein